MQYPVRFLAVFSTTLVEYQYLFRSNESPSGFDFFIHTGHFPEPRIGRPVKMFPIRPLHVRRREAEPLVIRCLKDG